MAKFVKKPVVIEAITFLELVNYGRRAGVTLYGGDKMMPWSFDYVVTVLDPEGKPVTCRHPITHETDDCYLIPTLEGVMKFHRGDLLITGVKGEIYPCRSDIFAATYEPICELQIVPAGSAPVLAANQCTAHRPGATATCVCGLS